MVASHSEIRGNILGPHYGSRRFQFERWLLPFIMGSLSSIFVNIGGRISLLEAILCAYLVVRLVDKSIIFGVVTKLGICLLLILVGFLLANMAHDRGLGGVPKEMINYAVLLGSAAALAQFLSHSGSDKILALVLGTALGEVFGIAFSPTAEVLIDPWKFGLGYAFTVVILFLVYRIVRYRLGRWGAFLAVFGLAGVHLYMGSRSIAGIVLLSGLLVLVIGGKRPASRALLFKVFLFTLVALAIIFVLYGHVASSGLLGPESTLKWESQAGDYGILLGARKELLLLIVAWLASPIYGWGPAALVDSEVLSGLYRWYVNHGYSISQSDFEWLFQSDALPLHSVVLGLLAQAGLFGIPLLLFVGRLWARSLQYSLGHLNVLLVFMTLNGGVHLLTSPLGDTTRFPIAFALAVGLLIVSRQSRERLFNDVRGE